MHKPISKKVFLLRNRLLENRYYWTIGLLGFGSHIFLNF